MKALMAAMVMVFSVSLAQAKVTAKQQIDVARGMVAKRQYDAAALIVTSILKARKTNTYCELDATEEEAIGFLADAASRRPKYLQTATTHRAFNKVLGGNLAYELLMVGWAPEHEDMGPLGLVLSNNSEVYGAGENAHDIFGWLTRLRFTNGGVEIDTKVAVDGDKVTTKKGSYSVAISGVRTSELQYKVTLTVDGVATSYTLLFLKGEVRFIAEDGSTAYSSSEFQNCSS